MADGILLYTIAGVTEVTGLPRTSIYGLLSNGSIEAVKVGRRTLIKASSLKAYIASLSTANIGKSDAAR